MKNLMENPKDCNLSQQIEVLQKILKLNSTAWKVLETAERTIHYPWYLAGGGIYHTVWNYYSNKPIESDLKDYDVFYFNKSHNEEEHKSMENTLNSIFDKPMIDLTNVATVHTWLKDILNKDVSPYKSIEEDINSFGSSVASVGVQKYKDEIKVYAPYGLHDIFSLEVHSIGGIFTKEEYLKKVKSWQERWPELVLHK